MALSVENVYILNFVMIENDIIYITKMKQTLHSRLSFTFVLLPLIQIKYNKYFVFLSVFSCLCKIKMQKLSGIMNAI